MTFLPINTQIQLQQSFAPHNMDLFFTPNSMVAEGSEDATVKKIVEIIKSAGYCALLSDNRRNNNFVFTITPYKIPESFLVQESFPISQPLFQEPALSRESKRESKSTSVSKLLSIFSSKKFVGNSLDFPKDRWSSMNNARTPVVSSLSQGLTEILLNNVRNNEHPIIEIGSALGYTFSPALQARIIRTQPNRRECQRWYFKTPHPIYKMTIEQIWSCLKDTKITVPLFFALNVFDTLLPMMRMNSLLQISELQKSGDRTILMLDTNPCLNIVLQEIQDLYPEDSVLPYTGKTGALTDSRVSVIIVPQHLHIKTVLSALEFLEEIKKNENALLQGKITDKSKLLHELQEKHQLKVIVLEEFIEEQLTEELQKAGYQTKSYYHVSFTPEKNTIFTIKNIIYKSITDIAGARQYSSTDVDLQANLARKKISFPLHVNETYLAKLKKQGKKLLCAEMLVIEATKK